MALTGLSGHPAGVAGGRLLVIESDLRSSRSILVAVDLADGGTEVLLEADGHIAVGIDPAGRVLAAVSGISEETPSEGLYPELSYTTDAEGFIGSIDW